MLIGGQDVLLPTTMVGNYPNPRRYDGHGFATLLKGEFIHDSINKEAFEDTGGAIVHDQEAAGLDVISDGKVYGGDSPYGTILYYYLERMSGYKLSGPPILKRGKSNLFELLRQLLRVTSDGSQLLWRDGQRKDIWSEPDGARAGVRVRRTHGKSFASNAGFSLEPRCDLLDYVGADSTVVRRHQDGGSIPVAPDSERSRPKRSIGRSRVVSRLRTLATWSRHSGAKAR